MVYAILYNHALREGPLLDPDLLILGCSALVFYFLSLIRANTLPQIDTFTLKPFTGFFSREKLTCLPVSREIGRF